MGENAEFVIVKSRTTGTGWTVWHKDLPGTLNDQYLVLDTTAASVGNSAVWGGRPDFNCIRVGTDVGTNQDNTKYVGYAWRGVPGFSKYGKYLANGSATDNVFVYTGFRPALIIGKRVDTSSNDNWFMNDTNTLGYNPHNSRLYPNLANGVGSSSDVNMDILSNGFKLYTSNSNSGGSGCNYVYAAWAQNPFKSSRAR